jgi:hypothetical protein
MAQINNGEHRQSNNHLDEYPNFEILDLAHVAERINVIDIDAVRRWCKENDVSTYKFTKKYFVYRLDFEYAVGKPFVTNLIKKHPDGWKDILRELIKWDALYHYFIFNFNDDHDLASGPTPAEGQEKLFKRLMK